MEKSFSFYRSSNGFAAGTSLLIAVAAVILMIAIISKTMQNTREDIRTARLSREQAVADGDIQFGLARLQKRINENLKDRINNGLAGKFIQESDLIKYNTQNPALFWTEWMNGVTGEPDFEVFNNSIASCTITNSDTEITILLRYVNNQITGGGFSTALYNDFTLRYAYEIITVQKAGAQTEGRTVIAKSYFNDSSDAQNTIQIRLFRSLSAYNLFTEYCTLPDGTTPIYDSKSYSGQVYSKFRFYVSGSPTYADTVHISSEAGEPPASHRDNTVPPIFRNIAGVNMLSSNREVLELPANLSEDAQRLISYHGQGTGSAIPGGLEDGVYGAVESLRMVNNVVELSSTCFYVKGNATIRLEAPEEGTTNYIYINVGGTTHTVSQRTGIFKDPRLLIFVEGSLRIQGEIACNSKTTIAARDSVIITGDIKYMPNNTIANPWPNTVLGLISWNGSILFSKDITPYGPSVNIDVNAVLMAPNGGIGAESWENLSSIPFMGTINHRGSIIRKYCLPSISSDHQRGWQFKSEYDSHLRTQKAPPYFPGNGRYKLDTDIDKLTVVDIFTRNK